MNRFTNKKGARPVAVTWGAVACCAIVFSGTAAGQQTRNLALPRFHPSPAGDDFFSLPSPHTPGNAIPRGGVLLDYAQSPLVIRDSDGTTVGRVIEHQMLLHVNVALAFADRAQLNLDLPIALVNRGDGTFEAGTFTGANAFVSPSGAGVGDLRLGARLRLLGEYADPFQLALGGYLWAPTGTRDDFLTDGKVRGQVHALGGGRVDRLVWAVMVGPTLQSTQSYGGVQVGSQLSWGAGAAILLGERREIQLGGETTGGVTLSQSTRSTNSEALLGIKVRLMGFLQLGLGGGRGIAHGLGTPDFRGIFSLFYNPPVVEPQPASDQDGDGILDRADACPTARGPASSDPQQNGCPPPADRDGDGILDNVDACPDESGRASPDPKANGCPPPDVDKDGIPDQADACPAEAGPRSDDPKQNGCPPPIDTDADGVFDPVDACPKIAGVQTKDPTTNGCPGDSDGDGVRDDLDACPHEKGPDGPDPAARGCPKLVRVTSDEIVILEQVQFETNKAAIKATSDALLASIAQVLQEHPEISMIEVQGHTDNRGKKKRNAKLSQERADGVVRVLVSRGVDGRRLSAKGYGQDAPIASNDSDEGRQKNRRVQFLITARTSTDDKAPVPAK